MPVPLDAPFAHAPGVNSDRILLIGSGITVGYGVVSHEQALGGELARELSRRTGRGAYVDIVAARDMTFASCLVALEQMQLSRFDAIVTTLSWSETMRLESASTNRRDIERLLGYIADNAPASLHLFVVAAPSLPSIVALPRLLGRIIDKSAAQLNTQVRLVCEGRRNVTWLPFDPTAQQVGNEEQPTYEAWARVIAPEIAAVVDEHAGVPRQREVVDEARRQGALERLGVDDAPDPQLDRLVRNARDLFGVSGASVTFIDRNRQWIKSAVGIDRADIPRAKAFCNITIDRDQAFVVNDATTDARFEDQPWVSGKAGVRFYAGYPIEAPDGHRIGTTCIVDVRPRGFSDHDAAQLRELALRVQSELWRTAYSPEG